MPENNGIRDIIMSTHSFKPILTKVEDHIMLVMLSDKY